MHVAEHGKPQLPMECNALYLTMKVTDPGCPPDLKAPSVPRVTNQLGELTCPFNCPSSTLPITRMARSRAPSAAAMLSRKRWDDKGSDNAEPSLQPRRISACLYGGTADRTPAASRGKRGLCKPQLIGA